MNKFIFILSILFALGISQKIEAKVKISYHNGPTFTTQQELPADITIDDKHVNLGIAFSQFGILGQPIWNYGKIEYALVTDDEEQAWVLTKEDLASLKAEYNLEIDEEPSLSMWQKIGLKPVILIILLLIIYGAMPSKKEGEDEKAKA